MSEEEEEANPLQELYTKAANAKRSLTRSKKDLQLALKALQEAQSSSHFFEELVKYQSIYRERRLKVYDIYDRIEDQISDELFKKDYGKQCKEIERDYEVLEEEARVAISGHQQALVDISAHISHARVSGGGGGGEAATQSWKIQSSFEPKPPLKLEMGGEELANWERQFKMYFDISNLRLADISTQRAVLQNCLHTDLQVRLHEGISGILDIKAGLNLIREEFKKRHPRVVRRHHLFSLEQKRDEYNFSDCVSRLDALARDADLTDLSKDSILCHLMLRACKDDDLRAKMLEVPEAEMSQLRLKEVIELYETIQRTNKGLSNKVKANRTKGEEGQTCWRCQQKNADHIAATCPVDAKTLFCRNCQKAGIQPPHLHNTYPTCQGKRPEGRKSDKKKMKKKEEAKAKEVKEGSKEADTGAKSKRVQARDESPAGEPESSEDEDVPSKARQVKSKARQVKAKQKLATHDNKDLPQGWMSREVDGWSADSDSSGEEEEEGERLNCDHPSLSNSTLSSDESDEDFFPSYAPIAQIGIAAGPPNVPIPHNGTQLMISSCQLLVDKAEQQGWMTTLEEEEEPDFVDALSELPEDTSLHKGWMKKGALQHLEAESSPLDEAKEEDDFEEAETCSVCMEEDEETSSPLPPNMRGFNCKHAECRLECEQAAKNLGEEAYARRCKHQETCSQGLPGFKDTPSMPVQLSMKASTMSKRGSWVVSCPDTGATSSLLKESVARAKGLRWKSSKVSLTSATGQAMRVSGEAILFAKVKGGHTRRIRVVISPDLEDDALISWSDQIKLGVLHEQWPAVLPENACADEEEEEEEQHCRGVRSEEEDAEYPPEWPEELKELLYEYPEVFSDTLEEDMRLKKGTFDLKLLPGVTPYQTNRVQRLNYHERAATDKELEKLLKGKVLRKYDPTNPDHVSPWLFTAQWIPKPHRPNQFRLTADFQELNKRIVKDVYHFKTPTELWREIKPESKVFISLDAQSAFHQLVASKETSRLCTVALPQGQFQYLVGAQGCSNTGSAFCRYSDEILAGTSASKGIDDILLQAPTLQALLPLLREVLDKAKEGGLTFSKKKVDFGKEVEFCGYLVTTEGIKPSPRKIDSIKSFSPPTDESSLRSFLGLCQQFSHYHPDLSQTCKPLRELLKKGNEWRWEKLEQDTFELVQEMMSKHMMETAYDPILPTRVLLDSSELGFGYLIAQWHQEKDCTCKKQVCTCRWRILWANSTTLKKSYKGIPPIYMEAIGARWALKDAAFYLKGVRSPFEVVTDHHALVGLSRKELPDLPEKLRDIFMEIRPYNCFWTHCPGAKNLMADCLSRMPNTTKRRWVEEPTNKEMDYEFCRKIMARQVTATDIGYIWHDPLLDEIIEQGSQDKEYNMIIKLLQERKDKTYIRHKLPSEHPARNLLAVWDRLGLETDEEGKRHLVTCDISRIVVPKGVDEQGNCDGHLRRKLLDKLHTAHLGTLKSCKAAAQRYYWPQLQSEMTQRCQECVICEENQRMNPEEPPVQEHDLAAYAMEFLGSDLFHFDGDTWLILVDFFSGFPLVKNLGKHSSTVKVIKRMKKWMNLLGYCRKIRVDGGPEYRDSFQDWCRQAGIKVEVASSYHPQSNCRAEGTIGNIKKLLRKCKEGGENFEDALAEWRMAPRADGPSCSELFFSRKLRSSILPEIMEEAPVEQNRIDRREQEILGRVERTRKLPLPLLSKGQKVKMLDKDGKWTIKAVVRDIRPNQKSYVVESNTGVYLRNRKYLRPQRSKEEEEESAETVGGNLTPESKPAGLETSAEAPAVVGRPRRKATATAERAPRGGTPSPVVTRARRRLLDRAAQGGEDAVH